METTIRDLIRTSGRTVHSVTPETSVIEALKQMAEHNIGAVLVIETSGTLAGLFSERDFARAAARGSAFDDQAQVRQLMTTELLTVQPGQTVQECMIFVTERRVRHLPVTDEQGRLVGLVSIGDLVKAAIAEKEYLLTEKQTLISKLQDYISGTMV